VGSVVYVQDGLAGIMDQSWLVIDGQQRLTTLTLLLEALARAIPAGEEPIEGFSSEKIRNLYLQNPFEKGDKKFKLHLSENDSETLKAIVSNKAQDEFPSDKSLRIDENFRFFSRKIATLKGQLDVLCLGLSKLTIVDINLNRNEDNPQLIFESMNSTGKALSQADLIRNFILMGLDEELQNDLYQTHWRPMEKDFGQEAYGEQFDAFMRHYLTVKTGSMPREDDVYEAFKSFAGGSAGIKGNSQAIVREIHRYSRFFCSMALGRETDKDLAAAFRDLLQDLNYTVAYPLLLKLYGDYADGLESGVVKLSKSDFLASIRLIESYIFRRSILEIPTNSMNKTFAEFQKHVQQDRYLESLKANFALMPSYRRFPTDEEFSRAIQTKDLYNIKARSYWLRKLENFNKKELVSLDDCTIEHVLPQNPKLSSEWQSDLGDNWVEIQQKYLHSLGNLTLTRYNSEYSDKPYSTKRNLIVQVDGIPQEVGLAKSPFVLNADFSTEEKWNESSIVKRAHRLAARALSVWPSPNISDDVLSRYAPAQPDEKIEFTIDDHEYLQRPEIRLLFEEFRIQVLNLAESVTETFLKQYVAYKTDSNFVTVVPQAKRLRLSLSIPIAELDDPRALAKDTTGLGRWGTGDTEVHLDSSEDMAYVLGLVRQSLDWIAAKSGN
jgi:uncharacterized protein with ParB-like and HNH nuclease domain/predicted transport protein